MRKATTPWRTSQHIAPTDPDDGSRHRRRRGIRRWASALTATLVIASLVGPAHAYFGGAYSWHDGALCGWDGTHEHWDYNSSQYDQAGGATGLQYGYPTWCDRTRLKMYWKPYDDSARLDVWIGYSGVNPGAQAPAEFLYYTDHDVREPDRWVGFRLYH